MGFSVLQAVPYASLLGTTLGFVRNNIILTLLFGLFCLIARRRYFHPLSRFPGPFFASVTSLWRVYTLHTRKQHVYDMAMHKKYGPVFRNAPNSLSFSDPNAIESIYGHRPRGEFAKSNWYRVFADTMDGRDFSAFASLPVQQHKRLKKRIAGAYSMSSIIGYEPRFDANIVGWIERIKGFGGEAIEFATWTHFLTLDLISDIVYGQPLGFVEKGDDINGYRTSLHEGFIYLTTFGLLQPALYLLKSKLLGPYIAPSPKDKTGYGHLLGFAEGVVKDRISNGDTIGRRHMVLDFIKSKNEDGSAIPFDQLVGEVLSTVNAGADSTTVIIAGTFNYILRKRNTYEKLVAEIIEASQKGQLSEPVVSYAETTKLPYLNAVVKESMRLLPVFSANMNRVVGKGGYEILPGVFVPGGVECGVNAYVCHRNKEIFGEDAEEFIPERWLPFDSARSRKMDKFFISWGYGNRTCLGRNIAQLELNKSIVELIRHFEVKLLRPDLPVRVINLVQMLIEDMYVQFIPRETKI